MRLVHVLHGLAFALLCAGLGACGGDDDADGDKSPGGIPEQPGMTPAQTPSPVDLRFDHLFYSSGATAQLSLRLPEGATDAEELYVAVASPDSQDAEAVTLRRRADGSYTADSGLPLDAAAPVASQDGRLRVAPGELIYALFSTDGLAGLSGGADIVADFAIIETAPNSVEQRIMPEVALSDDEAEPVPGAKPVGTLLRDGALPIQVATAELIVHARSQSELDQFLQISGATVRDTFPNDEGEYTAYLVDVDPARAKAENVSQLRALFGEEREIYASNQQVLQILALAMEYRLEGYVVSLNPRLQMAGAPAISATEQSASSHTMRMVGARTFTGPCVPGDPNRPCVENVPAVWAFNALWDTDDERINVAVLDMGFAPNDDFRTPESGAFVECDMTSFFPSYRCEAGIAQGPPTVGNSFFGGRSWHGTGVVTTIGGVVNNGFGSVGVAGQVAVPMMYKYDTFAHAFEIGRGVRKAVDDGASCINISGGYPCNVLTVGPDFNICTTGGRAELCAVLTAGVSAAAGLTCLTLGWIPFVGAGICAAAIAGAVASTAACIAAVIVVDVDGPMESGIQYATSKGVPVVTIAGNTLSAESMPPIVRDIVDLGERRTEAWGIIPAMIPDTIVAGAVNGDLDNAHFFGDRVDVWAPIPTTYLAPSNVDDMSSPLVSGSIGGTSAAAPFVTGVITVMMSVNPSLNPANPELNNSQRRAIVPRIREILATDEATLSNTELVAAGFTDQPAERRNIIDPLAVVGLAAAGRIPDIAAMGYDRSLGFSEALGANDTEAAAVVIPFEDTLSGTILAIPESSGNVWV